ncbi:glycine--tRNA ligase [Oscillospiraceae bacterium]|uniref:glycine--tRNA ligase n=1 Tax=Allofournierella sp. TaxID=1940256 RepID=UPI0015AFA8E6|nr:glycine--tRNA ligase [Oscillospiraceae bacterium]
MNNREKSFDTIVALCKNRGFVYPGSEIYGGLANSWDYGPLGVEFKNNVKKAWLKKFVQESPTNVGLDAAIIMNPETWITTGHVAGFSDPLLDCKACKARHRADKLIGDAHPDVNADAMSFEEMDAFIAGHEDVVCPVCGKHDFTPIRKFNLMFKTAIGVTEDSSSTCYLRPETAQGIFVNFANIQRTTRRKLPFGVCQVGKAFRNEITPGNFTFRTREFEQMECEFFCKPGTDLEWFAYWKDYCKNWLLSLGIRQENLRLRDHDPAELAFYSRATTDIEYAFPFTEWGELWGIADRTDYDLGRHQEASGKSLEYFDPETNEHYIPYVIEPSLGADRVALAFLCEAYDEEIVDEAKNDKRVVLRLHPALAPYKAAVLPLSKKLGEAARPIWQELAKYFMVDYDEAGSIGKRYRRQDEIGTPLCITVDFDTFGDGEKAGDGCVTIRDRDTMEQVRLPIGEVKAYIEKKIEF